MICAAVSTQVQILVERDAKQLASKIGVPLAIICPSCILGPVISPKAYGFSIDIMKVTVLGQQHVGNRPFPLQLLSMFGILHVSMCTQTTTGIVLTNLVRQVRVQMHYRKGSHVTSWSVFTYGFLS